MMIMVIRMGIIEERNTIITPFKLIPLIKHFEELTAPFCHLLKTQDK